MNAAADKNYEHNRGNRDTKNGHSTSRKWARRKLQLVVAICLVVLPFAVVAVAQEIESTGAPSNAQLVDGGSGGPIPLIAPRPTLCDGINAAVAARSGLGEILRSRGLTDQVPLQAASRLGRLGTVRCYADNLEGKLAVILLNQAQGSGIAITNDRSWVDELDIPFGKAVGGQQLDIVVAHNSNAPSSGSQAVNVDSILQGSKKGE